MAIDVNSPNKNYLLMGTGNDTNTWGVNLNANFSLIDNNLGGTLTLNVGGSSNINVSASQAQNLIHNLSGALTGNINYNFPAQGGFFAINNQTTGAFTLTVTVTGGSGGIPVPQGTTQTVYIDATVPQVESFAGTQYVFTAASVGGTGNAITIPTTNPSNFALTNGLLLTFTPVNSNTGATTVNAAGTGAFPLQKPTFSGVGAVSPFDVTPTFPIIIQYNSAAGGSWFWLNEPAYGILQAVSTTQNIAFGNNDNNYVATVSCTFNIAQTTTLLPYWYIGLYALGGAITIAINGSDALNGGSAGVGLTMPKGTSGLLTTDANGNLYLNGTAILQTPASGDNTTTPATTAFVQNSLIAVNSSFKNLNSVWVSNTTATLTVDQIILQTSSAVPILLKTVNVTFNTAATVGTITGLDTGTLAVSTWYFGYVIYNGTTKSCIFSASATSPVLPSGYTYSSGPVTAFLTNGSNNIIGFIQAGRDWEYRIGSNLSALQTIISGISGNVSTPTYTSVALGSYVPTAIAAKIKVSLVNAGSIGQAIVAPNASYGAAATITNAPPLQIGGSASVYASLIGEMILQSTNIYYASTLSACALNAVGFTLNI